MTRENEILNAYQLGIKLRVQLSEEKDKIIKKLIAVATGKIPHLYRGLCPEDFDPDSRDNGCEACMVIIEAENHCEG